MSAPLLSVDGLSVAFGETEAVRGVGFTVGAGEVVGIVGESGSGKSVTCRAVLGLLPPQARVGGDIRFEGQSLDPAAMAAARGRAIGMIFQNPSSHLDPLMRVGEQVAEPLRHHLGLSRTEARDRAVQLLEDVRIRDAARRYDAYPHELSGGMKQRVLIASAIACAPRLLLADEPTTALDVTVQAGILKLLRELNASRGLSMVLVSHDLGVVAEVCDRVVVMRHGEVVEEGLVAEVVARPRHDYTRLLIGSQPGRGGGGPATPARAAPAPLIEVRDLAVHFPARRTLASAFRPRAARPAIRALDGVSLSVAAGECFGIVGESGSGKSTLARAIVRLVEATSGEILHDGAPVGGIEGEALARYRRAVQMVFQSPYDSLNPRLRVREAIAEPIWRHRLAPRAEALDRAEELMELVELPRALGERRPQQLSGGQCQRVGIARALALSPNVLIADEITSALDVTIQAQILELLRRLRETRELTILYISHDLAVVRAFCDRVAIFRAGRLIEEGAVSEVFERPRDAYTAELIAAAPDLDAILARRLGAATLQESLR